MSGAPIGDPDDVDLGAEDALHLNLEEEEQEPRQWYRQRLTRVLYVAMAGFVGLVLGLVLMFVYVSTASKGGRAATCAVVAANRAEKQAQLQQYEESPPTTELARKLQKTYRESLATWDRLWSTLGCKEAAPPGP